METKRLVVLGALFVLLVVLVVIFFQLGGREEPKLSPSRLPSQVESSEEAKEPTAIVLFFPSEDDNLLHPEEREIILGPSEGEKAKQIIHELIRGSLEGYISPFPAESKLREFYITKEGVAYVDFSREIMEEHLSGSSAEISTIYSIVNTLSHNIESIKKVFILIDGGERQTLGGHIDLTKPFSPLFDIVAK
jgi:spore germination protein GerM